MILRMIYNKNNIDYTVIECTDVPYLHKHTFDLNGLSYNNNDKICYIDINRLSEMDGSKPSVYYDAIKYVKKLKRKETINKLLDNRN